MLLPHIDALRCTGCGWCVAACPPHVLSLQADGLRKHACLHDALSCTGCSKCERRCPLVVISMVRITSAQHDGDGHLTTKAAYTRRNEPNGTF